MSQFAENHLKKHGWEMGKGLGRDENGMSEPIKVKLKAGKAGVGHELGEQFTNHWWDDAFKNASENITVQHDDDGTKVSAKGECKHVSTRKYLSPKAAKNLLYGKFVKSAVLSNGVLSKDKDCVTEVIAEVRVKPTVLTDEELINACGGRTAHKGARHGLKLSGKLARLAAQEESTVLKVGTDSLLDKKSKKKKLKNGCDGVDIIPKKKRKKEKKQTAEINNDMTENKTELKNKKTKLKKKRKKD